MKSLVFAAAVLALAVPTAAGAAHGDHGPNKGAPAAAVAPAQGTGTIKAINARAGTVTIQHAPIPALKWPAMTMPFKATPEVLKGFKTGQKVVFTVRATKGTAEIVSMRAG